MLEEDIQYIGTKLAAPPVKLAGGPFPSRDLSGLILHVEKSSNEEGCRLVFRKANATVIQIGRRPPSRDLEKRQRDSENGKAMFKCPVVSRRHAKITFSDSGFAYLMDLGSHHGTHLKKKDELASKTLAPSIASMLHDGDVITFGKTVAKNEGLVRPVTARVELLYNMHPPPSKQLYLPSLLKPVPQPSILKPITGRFYVPSSGSSDDGSSDSDSDIEELPRPSPPPPPQSPATRAFFEHLLPAPTPPQSQCSQRLPPINMLRPIPVISFDDDDVVSNDGKDGSSSMEFSPSPRSTPPPDDANPLPSPPPLVESMLVGAWPHSRTPSPIPLFIDSSELRVSFPTFSPALPVTPTEIVLAMGDQEDGDKDEPPVEHASPEDSPQHTADTPPAEIKQDLSDEVKDLRAAFDILKRDVQKLNIHRRKMKISMTAQSSSMNEKLDSVKEELAELQSTCANLHDLVDGTAHWDVPDMQTQIDDLKQAIEAHGIRLDERDNGDDVDEPVPGLIRGMVEELKKRIDAETLRQDGELKRHDGELKRYGGELKMYDGELSRQNEELKLHGGELQRIEDKYAGELSKHDGELKLHGGELQRIEDKYDEELRRVEDKCDEEVRRVEDKCDEELGRVEDKCDEELRRVEDKYDAELKKYHVQLEKHDTELQRIEGKWDEELKKTRHELKNDMEVDLQEHTNQFKRDLKAEMTMFVDEEFTKHMDTDVVMGELISMRDESEKQMRTHVEAINAAKEEALKVIAEAQAQAIAAQNTHVQSLKRKRSAEEDVVLAPHYSKDMTGTPPKRPRTHFAQTVVKTAGMVTVGAVVAWGALAFS